MGPRPALGAGGTALGRAPPGAGLWLWAGLLGARLLGPWLLGPIRRARPGLRLRSRLGARVSRLPRRISWWLARRRALSWRWRRPRPALTPSRCRRMPAP